MYIRLSDLAVYARQGPAGQASWKKGFDESQPHGPIKSAAPRQPFNSFKVLCSALCPADLCSAEALSSTFHGSSFLVVARDGELVVVVDEEAAAGAVRVAGPGGGGGAEVQCRVQLRRLDHGHGQPVHEREAVADHLHAAPLRRDLLRQPHLPLLRRARHRRLPQQQVRAAVPAALQVHQRRLQEGRQHGHHRRHRHGRAILPLPGALRQDLEQRAHQLSNPVVPDDHLLRLRKQLQELPCELAVRVRRVRGQRLQRDAVRQLQHGPGQHVHAADHQHHRRRHREADRAGRRGHRGAGRAPHRLLPHLPHHLRHLQRRRLRQPRLPQEVQRPVHEPQQPAPDQDNRPPGQVQVRPHHVRRLLLRRLRHGQEPKQIRFQLGVSGVLRVGRRQVQLRQRRAVRDVRGVGVRQPGVAPQLGRHPPHRGRIQADHRRMAQRCLLPPGHPPQLACLLAHPFIIIGANHYDEPIIVYSVGVN